MFPIISLIQSSRRAHNDFFAILLYASTTFTLHLVNKPVIPPSGLLVDESQMAGTVALSSASTSTQSSPYQYGSNLNI
jgi:hypothetical protein